MFSSSLRMRWLAAALLATLSGPAFSGTLLLMKAGKGVPGAAAVMMVSPIMALGGGTTGPGNAATNYATFHGGAGSGIANWSTSAGAHAQPITVAGTIDNLSVNLPAGTGAGTWKFTLFKTTSGTSQTLTCTVGAGASTCSDTGNGHAVTVSPGDLIGWKSEPASTPTAQGTIQLSATFTSTVGQEAPLMGPGGQAGGTTVIDYNGLGIGRGWNATEVNVSSLMPTSGTVDQLEVADSVAAGAGAGRLFTVFKNGSPAPAGCTPGATGDCLECLVSGTGAGGTICSDLNAAHAVTYAAGDTISIRDCMSAASALAAGCPSTANGSLGTAPAGAVINPTLRWVPASTNEFPVFQTANTVPATNATRYSDLSGSSWNSSTESDNFNMVPVGTVLASGLSIKKLYESQNVAPGGVTTRTVTVRTGTGTQADSALTCTITSAATSCNDTSNSAAGLASSSFVNLGITQSGTNAALTWFKTGAVVTVP